jgi:hypothetical protein
MKNNQPNNKIIIYQNEANKTKIDVRLENDTVWLSQNALAELFQTTKQNIGQHIKNIFEEGELIQRSTVKKFFTVQIEDNRKVSRDIEYYKSKII